MKKSSETLSALLPILFWIGLALLVAFAISKVITSLSGAIGSLKNPLGNIFGSDVAETNQALIDQYAQDNGLAPPGSPYDQFNQAANRDWFSPTGFTPGALIANQPGTLSALLLPTD
jgi:hypothetical protein